MPTRSHRRPLLTTPDTPVAGADRQPAPAPGRTAAVPPWHVVEIEGEATPVVEHGAAPQQPPGVWPAIPDRPDEVIVAGLDKRQLTVLPGEKTVLRLALLNNGDRHACFSVQVEGWIDERWIHFAQEDDEGGEPSVRRWLHSGERALLTLVIAPPRLASSTAGERPFAIVVRAVEYGERLCRLGVQLTLQPYTALTLGEFRPQQLVATWRRRAARLLLPITNQGNVEVTLFVQGHDAGRTCQIALRVPDSGRWQQRRVTFTLGPGQTTQVLARITPPTPPLLGLRPRRTRVRLAVGLVKAEQTPLAASAPLLLRPLIGPWPLAGVCALLALLAGGALLFTTLAATLARPAAAPPRAAPPPAPAPQIVTIVLNLAQPAPISPAAPAGELSPAPSTTDDTALSPPQLIDSNAPIVRRDQVTAPGAPSPVESFQPATPHSALTYQQMFQEIALRYDLSWRLLAAQAYLESGFDALALGNSGAMGLMQIMPGTWREWAPVVDVNDPFDAYSNTLVAAAYLDYLRTELSRRGQSETQWMLVAYNWGFDKLVDHLQAGGTWETLPAESSQYAGDILRIAETIPSQ